MENEPATLNDFNKLERQETSESAPKRRIPVACDHNPNLQKAEDQIATALIDAASLWRENRDPRTLRRALFELFRVLEG